MPFNKISKMIVSEFKHWEIICEGTLDIKDIELELMDLLSTEIITVSIHAPFSDLNIASLNERIRTLSVDIILGAINVAAELDIELITIHPGLFSPYGLLLKDRVKKTNIESIIEIAQVASDNGICLGIENMPFPNWTLGTDPRDIKYILDTLNNAGLKYPDVGFTFDIGHAHTSDTLSGFLKKYFISHLVNIHVHNNNGRRDEHLPLNKGTIDIKSVLQKINIMAKAMPKQIIIEANTFQEGIESKVVLKALLDDLGIRYR